MINIQTIKARKQIEFAKKYYNKNIEELNEVESYLCSTAAEVFAYVDIIIPEDYRKFTIFNFQGFYFDKKTKEKHTILSKDISISARNVISQYCWGVTWDKIRKKFRTKKQQKNFLNNNSVLMKRMDRGNDVIIFGDSANKQIGRTLAASIIMKEAIKLRFKRGQRVQTYNWIDYPILKEALIKDSNELLLYETCSWLVVDNISNNFFSSEKQRAYITELITPFFFKRFSNNLPTILVFQFDIRKNINDIADDMGAGIAKIVNNKKTFKIALSE